MNKSYKPTPSQKDKYKPTPSQKDEYKRKKHQRELVKDALDQLPKEIFLELLESRLKHEALKKERIQKLNAINLEYDSQLELVQNGISNAQTKARLLSELPPVLHLQLIELINERVEEAMEPFF